jgi:Patatin-like phospholipase
MMQQNQKSESPPELSATLSAAQVIDRERKLLYGYGTASPSEVLGVGLSISGGGIRSASFSLGAFQALLSTQIFSRLDYLSTVSGGGYLGAAISWLNKLNADKPNQFKSEFGSAAIGIRSGDDAKGSRAAGDQGTATDNGESTRQYVWLDYIRAHGNYLLPPGISYLGVVATVLRGMLFNLAVYGALLTALFAFFIQGGVIQAPDDIVKFTDAPWWRIDSWLTLLGLLFAASVLMYGVATWLASLSVTWSIVLGPILLLVFGMGAFAFADTAWALRIFGSDVAMNVRWPLSAASAVVAAILAGLLLRTARSLDKNTYGRANQTWHYRSRVKYTDYLGAFCGILLCVLVVWSLHPVYRGIASSYNHVVATATLSSVLGAVGGVFQFFIGRSKGSTNSWLANLRIMGSSVLLIYGLGLLTYSAAAVIADSGSMLPYGILAASLVIGFCVNTNYLGLSRMYRDRLMEAFMPNADSIKANRWSAATEADETALVDFRTEEGGVRRPLHLINCNVVMIDSVNDRFRGRGGDSFVLSPLCSGSDATGWVPTEKLGDGALTLATAMATSGAAANPNAGVAGAGITRNRLVSFLMSMLNIRLGYWLPNPRHKRRFIDTLWPNLWTPGLRQGLLGRGLNEDAAFIELTDGGHFENTALYELIRRRVKVVIAIEAGQDEGCKLDDLANAIERVRVDFGVHIRFDDTNWDLSPLRAEPTGLAGRGFAIGTIRYPMIPQPENDEPTYIEGAILYLQATAVKDMRPDTQSYWRRHEDFPNQPTANQFFEEEQLEAYREVGLRIGRSAIAAVRVQAGTDSAPMLVLRELVGPGKT